MFVSARFFRSTALAMESCTKRNIASHASRKNLRLNNFGLLQSALCAPLGGHPLFSEGVLILAGVVIGDAKYTSIVIPIWISNNAVTIADIISFDVDLINIGNVRVVEFLNTR